MPRKPTIGYYASRTAYYTKVKGEQYRLAVGPDDAPDGPTYLAALDAFKDLMGRSKVDSAGNENTVRTLFNAYLDACEGKKRGSTLALKRSMLKTFVDRHGELKIGQVKPFHAESVIAEMRKPRTVRNRILKWSDGTVATFLLHLKAAFGWGVKNELISRNPLKNVETPHSRTRARERIVSPEEHATVLATLCHPHCQPLRRLIAALENTGARPGELCNATMADFNPQLGTITYFADDKRREDEFAHKTAGNGKDRTIYLTGEVLETVKEQAKGKKPTDLIFPNNKGRKYSRQVLAGCFRNIRKRTGLRHYVPYAYRHTLATRWLEAGKPVEMLAELLGNTPATIHKHYSHLCRSHATLRGMLEEFRKGK